LALALATPRLGAGEAESSAAITSAELLGHVRRLASDAWEGRGSGTAGEREATRYIADHFARLGLEPAGEQKSFFQTVRMPGRIEVDPSCRFEVAGAEGPPLAVNEDWRPFSLSISGEVEGDVVFAGYGITAPALAYDDYDGLDVKGKIVVVFRHLPHGAAPWRGPQVRQRHAPFVAKLNQALKRGAAALVVVNDPFHFRAPPEGAPRPRRARADRVQRGSIGGAEPRIPFVHLTLAAARRVFPVLFGATPEELEAAIHAVDPPRPVARAGRVRARLAVQVRRTYLMGRNVCALLRAGAADARDEVVVLGAHHDHLGKGGGFGSLARTAEERQRIHNGADDNASGTAGVLEVAAYLAPRRDRLRRSVLLLTFTGEERGLLGSRYFVDHPTLPLARIVAMVNLDMIGRLEGRKLFVGGVKTSPVFAPLLERRSAEVDLPVVFGDGGRAPSDNTSFYAKQLPVLFFFTGMHRDYHRPSDDADRIDAAGIEKVTLVVARVVEDLAQLPARPAFRRADRGGAGPPRPILGIGAGPAPRGVAVARIMPGSPAARSGLAEGDVILALAGTPTPDLMALREVMRKRRIGETVTVKVSRAGKEIEVEVTLGRG
jgi:hypothetical protein